MSTSIPNETMNLTKTNESELLKRDKKDERRFLYVAGKMERLQRTNLLRTDWLSTVLVGGADCFDPFDAGGSAAGVFPWYPLTAAITKIESRRRRRREERENKDPSSFFLPMSK